VGEQVCIGASNKANGAQASPPLWSEDQGFLLDQRCPTGSLAGFQADEHHQLESCREEGAKEKKTFGILEQADESAHTRPPPLSPLPPA
jgi:hypothetical protein